MSTLGRYLGLGANLDDIAELAAIKMGEWKERGASIATSGDPTMLLGGISGVESNTLILDADFASGNITATETSLWSPSLHTPIAPLNYAPKVFELVAFGQQTTAATPGTMTFTPRIGTTNAGSTLSGSTATAQTASETTTDWVMEGNLVVRSIGAEGGTNAVAKGMFHYFQGTATTAGSIVLPAMHDVFGGTSGTWDPSTTTALWMGATAATSTTNTFNTMAVIWISRI